MFSGVFNELAPEQIVALCSCLVFEEKVGIESLFYQFSLICWNPFSPRKR